MDCRQSRADDPREADEEELGEIEADGLTLADGEIEALGEREAEGDRLAEAEDDGLTLALGETDALGLIEAEIEADGLLEALGD